MKFYPFRGEATSVSFSAKDGTIEFFLFGGGAGTSTIN
jgi:hypothetical protein